MVFFEKPARWDGKFGSGIKIIFFLFHVEINISEFCMCVSMKKDMEFSTWVYDGCHAWINFKSNEPGFKFDAMESSWDIAISSLIFKKHRFEKNNVPTFCIYKNGLQWSTLTLFHLIKYVYVCMPSGYGIRHWCVTMWKFSRIHSIISLWNMQFEPANLYLVNKKK